MDIQQFEKLPILGIIRGITKPQVKPVFQASLEAGVSSLEIALNTPMALELISYARSVFGKKVTLGAGTVLSLKEAKSAIKAGAAFLVAPNFNKEIAHYCITKNIPFFPGALTPSEIYEAWQNGATMVKVFPASLFGPGYLKVIKGPFSNIKLMAVSGVRPENIVEYFENGAQAVAIGGSVFKKEWIETGKWDDIKGLISQYVQKYMKEVKLKPLLKVID